jgi:predicted phage tail protein
MNEIAIRGSGGDEPSGGEFSEAPDTLLTSQFVEAVYLIGEGEIEGFAHGDENAMRDIYLRLPLGTYTED